MLVTPNHLKFTEKNVEHEFFSNTYPLDAAGILLKRTQAGYLVNMLLLLTVALPGLFFATRAFFHFECVKTNSYVANQFNQSKPYRWRTVVNYLANVSLMIARCI